MSFGSVHTLWRYPVKSMLGEELTSVEVTTSGLAGDREFALVDHETGLVASAKRPKLWRSLLQRHALTVDGEVRITLPDGSMVTPDDPEVDRVLSGVLGRRVHLSGARTEGAEVARPSPEDVIENGDDADLAFHTLQIGQGTTGTSFVDYAAVHLITTTTLEHVGEEMVRYRPNIVVSTPSGTPYDENHWVGREITIGQVRLRGTVPTPRCAVPTLEHGDLPRSTAAVRTLLDGNRVEIPDFGAVPCLGLYAEVLVGGTVHLGDQAHLR